MKSKKAKADPKPRTSYKTLYLNEQAKTQEAEWLLATVRQNLSDERRFTESMANLLQLVSIVDGVRQIEKEKMIDVYKRANPSWRPPGRNWEVDHQPYAGDGARWDNGSRT